MSRSQIIIPAAGAGLVAAGLMLEFGGGVAHADETISPVTEQTPAAVPATSETDSSPIVAPAEDLTSGPNAARTHEIAMGDTLYSIAKENGTTVDAIVAASANNGIVIDPDNVPVGTAVIVPESTAATPVEVLAAPEADATTKPTAWLLPSLNLVDEPLEPAAAVDTEPAATEGSTQHSLAITVVDSAGVVIPSQTPEVAEQRRDPVEKAINNAKTILGDTASVVVDAAASVGERLDDAGSNVMNIIKPDSETLPANFANTLAAQPNLHTIVLPSQQVIHMSDGVTVRAETDGSLVIIAPGTNVVNSPGPAATPVVEAAPAAPTAQEQAAVEPVAVSSPLSPEVGATSSYKEYQASRSYPEVPTNLEELKSSTDGIKNETEKVAARYEHYHEYSDWLFSSFEPTVEGYTAFALDGINKDHIGIWGDKPPLDRDKTITPEGVLTHWMAGRPDSVEQFAAQMKHDVQFTVFPDGTVYQLTDQPNSYAWHASGANDKYIAAELWGFDVMDMTPQELESWTYAITKLMIDNNIVPYRDIDGIESTKLDKYGDYMPSLEMIGNVIGHKEADKLLNHDPTGKIDPSSFTMNSLYLKVAALYDQLMAHPESLANAPAVVDAPADAENTQTGAGAHAFLDGDEIDVPAVTEPDAQEPAVATPPEASGTGETVATTTLGELHAHDFPYLSLLQPDSLNYTCSADEAVQKSLQGPIYAGANATLRGEAAYGHKFETYEIYLFHYAAAIEKGDTPEEADQNATDMTEFAEREGDGFSCLAGDLVPDANGVLAYSFGPNQQRHDSDQPYRDPQANVDPIQSARNVRYLYKDLGLGKGPWHSDTYPVSDAIRAKVQVGRERALKLIQSMSEESQS